jgi:hypothetical protein
MRRNFLTVATAALTLFMMPGMGVSADPPNPRLGRWKQKSDAPPSSNIMTYGLYGKKGMKITIDQVDKDGKVTKWGYNTNFDGKDEPLYGNPGTDTGSVRVVNAATNEIVYRKDGKITQVLTNVLTCGCRRMARLRA